MKYLDGFRNAAASKALISRIDKTAASLSSKRRPVRIMEVCGTHTMAIARNGIRSVLPENIELISGPGCPVCVTDAGYIDVAIELAKRGVIVASFGDMLKVPGSRGSLDRCRSEGGSVEVCYSPTDAIELAKRNEDREIVFLGIGFETTVCPVVSLVDISLRNEIKNISVLTAFKLVPPALDVLASDPEIQIDAFLCPAHVSAIIGANAYEPVCRKYNVACVIAGFEPLDILLGLQGILDQIDQGEIWVENQYNRVVKPEGNKKAQALIDKYLRVADVPWRGIGVIPGSGLALKPEYEGFDAEKRHGVKIEPGRVSTKCRCGEVLKGILKPPQCELFGEQCSPRTPIGPCMVSSEGSCSAYYKYGGAKGHE